MSWRAVPQRKEMAAYGIPLGKAKETKAHATAGNSARSPVCCRKTKIISS